MQHIKLFLYSLFVCVALFASGQVQALTLTPVRIEVEGDPGSTVVRPIELINEQNAEITFYSSFSNFEAQGESGNPAFTEPKEGLGTWMKLPESITLGPKQSKKINLVIDIPKDAYSGGHFAVAFFGTLPNASRTEGVGIGAKTGVLVLLSVKGEVLEAGGVSSFNLKDNKRFYNSLPVSFQYRFRNDGNDRVKPEGTLTIHNAVYYPTERLNGNPVSGNILPKSTRLFNLEWVENPRASDFVQPTGFVASFSEQALYQWNNFAVGPYLASLDLVYGTNGIRTTKSVFFFVFPWQLLICLIILFIIVFFVGRILLRRYNKYIIKKARAGMEPMHDANYDK